MFELKLHEWFLGDGYKATHRRTSYLVSCISLGTRQFPHHQVSIAHRLRTQLQAASEEEDALPTALVQQLIRTQFGPTVSDLEVAAIVQEAFPQSSRRRRWCYAGMKQPSDSALSPPPSRQVALLAQLRPSHSATGSVSSSSVLQLFYKPCVVAYRK